jgi:hypothetical protein
MIEVKRRAQTGADRAGDPLDGLVNLFDLGIVLAVAFLLAALQSLHQVGALTQKSSAQSKQATIQVTKNQKVVPLKPGTVRVAVKSAKNLGSVYQRPDGTLIYVTKAVAP